jgi:hypothetical protein
MSFKQCLAGSIQPTVKNVEITKWKENQNLQTFETRNELSSESILSTHVCIYVDTYNIHADTFIFISRNDMQTK